MQVHSLLEHNLHRYSSNAGIELPRRRGWDGSGVCMDHRLPVQYYRIIAQNRTPKESFKRIIRSFNYYGRCEEYEYFDFG
jgi:hypothetical protein